MRIGVLPPAPLEPLVAAGHEVVNLWSLFFFAEDRSAWERAGTAWGTAGEPSLWARCLPGMLEEGQLDTLVHAVPGTPVEFQGVLKRAEERGIKVRPFHFPLLRHLGRLEDEIAEVCREFGARPERLAAVVERWGGARIALKRMDGLQGRNAAYATSKYLGALARGMWPQGDLETHRREVEARFLDYPGLSLDRWTRLASAGLTPYRPELHRALERGKAVIVYDEWGIENNLLGSQQSLAALLHQSNLPFGLKRRQERLLKEIEARRIRGVLFGVESIASGRRDEAFLRSRLPIPVLTVDTGRTGEMDRAEREALERFLHSCVEGI